MNLKYFIDRFSKNREVFKALIEGVDVEQAKWKPHSDKWSILEVVNHLYDEEREDFRQRLELVLADPEKPWPSINPRAWVAERKYLERDLTESLNNFLGEREKSLEWLSRLSAPHLENSKDGPNGVLSGGDLLASWLAHDFLHIRQITRLHYQYVTSISQPYRTAYAGPWKEPVEA
jgi:hypothetical protein